MKVNRINNSYTYTINNNDQTFVFEECTLGKYKGKTFMVNKEKDLAIEVDIIKSTNIPRVFGNGKICIPEDVKIKKSYSYNEIFFSIARTTNFNIEDGNAYFGYTFNQYWNGWEMPMFTKDIARTILNDTNCVYYYDEKVDTYYYKLEDDEEFEVAKGYDIKNELNETIHVYDIGNGWVWEEIKTDKIEERD